MPAALLLFIAVVLFALASPLVKFLVQEGGDAISFCNVLFIGNLCAGGLVVVVRGPRRLGADLRRIRPGDAWMLAANVGFAILIPALVFTALETTSVTNVVLLGRLEAVMFAAVSALLYRTRPSRWQVAGFAVITVGIVALVLIQGMGRIATGDWLVMLAAFAFALAASASKQSLKRISVPAFVFIRNITSSIVFFVIAVWLYGFEHFAEAFAPGLWGVMLVYALVVVVIGQLAWYVALREVRPPVVANATMLTPILAITFAYLLLGDVPARAQWIGGAIILVGMFLARRGPARPPEQQVMEKGLAAA